MVDDLQRVLASHASTSTIPVAGFVVEDTRGVAALRAGEMTKRLAGSGLLRSASTLSQTLRGWFPELLVMPSPPVQAAPRQAGVDAAPPRPSPVQEHHAWRNSHAAGQHGGVR